MSLRLGATAESNFKLPARVRSYDARRGQAVLCVADGRSFRIRWEILKDCNRVLAPGEDVFLILNGEGEAAKILVGRPEPTATIGEAVQSKK